MSREHVGFSSLACRSPLRMGRLFFATSLFLGSTATAQQAGSPPPESDQPIGALRRINTCRLPAFGREQLISQMPVRVGDKITPQLKDQSDAAIKQFDDRLYPIWVPGAQAVPDSTVDLWIVFPASALGLEGSMIPERIQVGRRRMEELLIQSVAPQYPQAAKNQTAAGDVRLKVVVGRDGTVSDAEFLEGYSLLVPVAIDAVKQWRYSPTLLNCVPVEVETEVIVSFRREEGEAQPRRP